MPMQKSIALPIETKVRELDGKLLIALELAKLGYKTAVGKLSVLNNHLDKINPHLYIGDSAVFREWKFHLYESLKGSGALVGTLDTEGGLFILPEVFKKRLDERIVKNTDFYLAWGSKALELLLEDYPSLQAPSSVTGNPGFDFANPRFHAHFDEEMKEIKGKYQNYILFNTNFSRVNHFDEAILNRTTLTKNMEGKVEYQRELYEKFVVGMKAVVEKFTDVPIVIRPHPSENHDTYRKMFADCPHVAVEHKYSVYPWIHASSLVIHNSCTTALESALAKKTPIAYRPIRNETFDLFLPNYVSAEVETVDELLETVAQTLGRNQDYQLSSEQKKRLDEFTYNSEGFAFERVASSIKAVDEMLGQNQNLQGLKIDSGKSALQSFIQGSKSIVKNLIGGNQTVKAYEDQKFPGLTKGEVEEKLTKLKAACSYDFRTKVESVEGIETCFWISLDD